MFPILLSKSSAVCSMRFWTDPDSEDAPRCKNPWLCCPTGGEGRPCAFILRIVGELSFECVGSVDDVKEHRIRMPCNSPLCRCHWYCQLFQDGIEFRSHSLRILARNCQLFFLSCLWNACAWGEAVPCVLLVLLIGLGSRDLAQGEIVRLVEDLCIVEVEKYTQGSLMGFGSNDYWKIVEFYGLLLQRHTKIFSTDVILWSMKPQDLTAAKMPWHQLHHFWRLRQCR